MKSGKDHVPVFKFVWFAETRLVMTLVADATLSAVKDGWF